MITWTWVTFTKNVSSRDGIRALASARGSVATRGPEGPEGGNTAARGPESVETEAPKGPRTFKRKWRLPALLYVFHGSAENLDFYGSIQIP